MSSKKDLKNLAIHGLVGLLGIGFIYGAIKHIDSKQKYISLGDARIETRDSNGNLINVFGGNLSYNPKNNTFKEEENNIYKYNLVPVGYKVSR